MATKVTVNVRIGSPYSFRYTYINADNPLRIIPEPIKKEGTRVEGTFIVV